MPNHDPCLSCRRLLSAHADGELSAPLAEEVEEHLASCPACRVERESLLAVMRALDTLAAPKPRMAPADAVMEEISRDAHPMSIRRLIPAPLCAAAAGLLAGILLAGSMTGSRMDAGHASAPDGGDATLMAAMDVFSPSPRGSVGDAYFAMIGASGR